ncbi:MAG: ATP-dependent 6-phosphofructokinase [Putridiphycobacter sp.]|nr:ATP-dependent 6-phosphofructokinase [Putridiphycobacter sp.]
MTKIQNIGVLTSGGDSPGMNACIRAIVRQGLSSGLSVFGIYDGFNGMIDNHIKKLVYGDVSNIIQRGGTILGTARSERFLDAAFRKVAFENLKDNDIDGVIVLGGDGSFKGAKVFFEEYNLPFIGVPCTIDNDINGTEYTIGFDTALNNAISAIDKIKDTASAHHRIFLVEVMGNNSGLIALNTALTTGSEDVFIPEIEENFAQFETKIQRAISANKSSIIIVSEGDEIGGARELFNYLKTKNLHQKIRVTVLGHIQRGGAPTFLDRKMATEFGVMAINQFVKNNYNRTLGLKNGKIYTYDFESVKGGESVDFQELLNTIHSLSLY